MEKILLHPNATPIYGFLSFILSQDPRGEASQPWKILDCGAGGPISPLALFHNHGFETWGIDTSQEQLDKAIHYCEQKGIDAHLRVGDMRHIPYTDGTFDYIYEHYSMCHLNKRDTAVAVREMQRVLKPQGLCFLGVISTDSWPKSLFGEEQGPGEYWGEEGGNTNVLHSMFSDKEADELVAGWEIVNQEKQVRFLREAAAQTSMEEWIELHREAEPRTSHEAWREGYTHRTNAFRYAHLYYYLRKL